ncbi:MAG TPA: hypothetical protein PLX89_26410 [Verrucomicrobiota bacterium]|nr:hypothetical protein [Verrucomicrobiota bacterium]
METDNIGHWRFHTSFNIGRWKAAVSIGVLGLVGLATAQNLSIDWHTIDGGGGTSSGGPFSLSGTIGQSDVGAQPMTGGNFTLTGGFWSLSAVQTPDAPLLKIRLISADSAQLSWPSPSTDVVLQVNSDLNSTNWVNAPQTVTDDGTNRVITVSAPGGGSFYRLLRP